MPQSNTLQRTATLKLAELDARSFYRKFVAQNTPVHLTGTTNGWKTAQWDSNYLISMIGRKMVKVFYNDQSTFDYNAGAETGVVKRRTMPFSDAFALINSEQGGKYYLNQQDMAKEFPELLKDISRPALLDVWKQIDATNLWIGGKGCKTPLHFDRRDNLLVQVKGRKHITLFPPEQSCNLYPALGDVLEHCSRLNVFEPDLSTYPLFAEAELHKAELTLEPGDTLFIPVLWWHAVESLESSISVNVWWHSIT
jgi:uncharacterized protein YqkB